MQHQALLKHNMQWPRASARKAVKTNEEHTKAWVFFTLSSHLIKPSSGRRGRRKPHSSDKKMNPENTIQSLINSLKNQTLTIISFNYCLTKEESPTHPPTLPPTATSKTKNTLVHLENNYHPKPLPVPLQQHKTLLDSFMNFSDLLLF